MQIDKSGTIEQHSTWIAANAVVGCPKGCEYCFLRPSNLTQVKPEELRTPEDSITELLGSNLYHPDIPVAIGTRTDMFSTPDNLTYLKEYLTRWNALSIPNTLVMITKCKIPDELIEMMGKFQQTGSSFVVFLSYSGLTHKIERGINHPQLKENFPRLKEGGIPVIHYWRPFTPQNSTLDVMVPVLETASASASSSMIAGLKMTEAMVKQFGFWPELQKLDIDPADYESVYTQEAIDHIAELREANPDYPIYYASSCSIANALKNPEANGVWGTEVCKKSQCSLQQRGICDGFHRERDIDKQEIEKALASLGIDFEYTVVNEEGVNKLIIKGEVDDNLVFNISQRLKMIVIADKIDVSNYGWGSQVYKHTLIVSSNINEQ